MSFANSQSLHIPPTFSRGSRRGCCIGLNVTPMINYLSTTYQNFYKSISSIMNLTFQHLCFKKPKTSRMLEPHPRFQDSPWQKLAPNVAPWCRGPKVWGSLQSVFFVFFGVGGGGVRIFSHLSKQVTRLNNSGSSHIWLKLTWHVSLECVNLWSRRELFNVKFETGTNTCKWNHADADALKFCTCPMNMNLAIYRQYYIYIEHLCALHTSCPKHVHSKLSPA